MKKLYFNIIISLLLSSCAQMNNSISSNNSSCLISNNSNIQSSNSTIYDEDSLFYLRIKNSLNFIYRDLFNVYPIDFNIYYRNMIQLYNKNDNNCYVTCYDDLYFVYFNGNRYPFSISDNSLTIQLFNYSLQFSTYYFEFNNDIVTKYCIIDSSDYNSSVDFLNISYDKNLPIKEENDKITKTYTYTDNGLVKNYNEINKESSYEYKCVYNYKNDLLKSNYYYINNQLKSYTECTYVNNVVTYEKYKSEINDKFELYELDNYTYDDNNNLIKEEIYEYGYLYNKPNLIIKYYNDGYLVYDEYHSYSYNTQYILEETIIKNSYTYKSKYFDMYDYAFDYFEKYICVVKTYKNDMLYETRTYSYDDNYTRINDYIKDEVNSTNDRTINYTYYPNGFINKINDFEFSIDGHYLYNVN